jgi:hypothetical protein
MREWTGMKKETEARNAGRNVGIFKVINYQVFKGRKDVERCWRRTGI